MNGVTACLWFDGVAEEAANFYAATIPGSSVGKIARAPADFPSGRKGDVPTVELTIAGRPFMGLNGGPHFTFNEAVSFVIHCTDQAEVDRLWDALSAVPEAEQCGWCKDRYGLSWQIVPDVVPCLLADPGVTPSGSFNCPTMGSFCRCSSSRMKASSSCESLVDPLSRSFREQNELIFAFMTHLSYLSANGHW